MILKIFRVYLWPLSAVFLFQCIGTDAVDDANDLFPVVIKAPTQNSLLVGETLTLSAQRQTMGGEEIPTESFTWTSDNPSVAEVSTQGVVQAVSAGQTRITATVGSSVSDPWLLTVVSDEDEVAQIVVSASKTSLETGETLQLMAQAQNVSEGAVDVSGYTWTSSDESVVTVDATGLATAVGNGSAGITASAEGVASTPFSLVVGAIARTGTFKGSGSYNADGTATLELNEDGELILTTSEDFQADLALGTFLYLSNSTSGSTTATTGVEIADISADPSGVKTFNISEINAEIESNTYRYIIILCKPARITFGFADLEEE